MRFGSWERFIAAAVLAASTSVAASDLRIAEAVKRRDPKAVAELIKAKADVNAAQPDGATALAWAAYLDDRASVDLLMAAGANVKTADEDGETPLTLAAANGDEAIRMSSIHPGNVHLLLTDVVMPKANGGELAGRLRRLRKNTRVLYMSGYPAETALQHGLDPDVAFLEKPFRPDALARKVREVLDAA